MLGPTKEMFDIMPAIGNKTEVNQILNGQDSAFLYGCTAPSTVSSLTEKKKEKKRKSLKDMLTNSKSDFISY